MNTNNDPIICRFYKWLDGRPLMDFYTIRIEKDGDTKRVYFMSRIHVNRDSAVSFSFSDEFSDYEILEDLTLLRWVQERYGSVYPSVY